MRAVRHFDRIIAQCREIRFRDFARWRVSRFGLASNERLGALMNDSSTANNLRICTSRRNCGHRLGNWATRSYLRKGYISDAIRASCAFPGLFEPVHLGPGIWRMVVLWRQCQRSAAREMGADIVVGVSVGLHDGHRGAPTNIFQVVSRSVSAAQKHQLECGSGTPILCCGPMYSRWHGTISSASTRPSRQVPVRRCQRYRN